MKYGPIGTLAGLALAAPLLLAAQTDPAAAPAVAPSIQEPAHPGGITAPQPVDDAGPQEMREMRAGTLTERHVHTAAGEDIGEVGMVVEDPDGERASVIVEVGGFPGIGEEVIAIPLRQLSLRDDSLHIQPPVASDRLRESFPFKEREYVRIPEYRIIASALEGGGDAQATFRAIDRNGDNRLTRDEAAAWGLVVDGWNEADRDNDGYLDESEFAAAEWDPANVPRAERQ